MNTSTDVHEMAKMIAWYERILSQEREWQDTWATSGFMSEAILQLRDIAEGARLAFDAALTAAPPAIQEGLSLYTKSKNAVEERDSHEQLHTALARAEEAEDLVQRLRAELAQLHLAETQAEEAQKKFGVLCTVINKDLEFHDENLAEFVWLKFYEKMGE